MQNFNAITMRGTLGKNWLTITIVPKGKFDLSANCSVFWVIMHSCCIGGEHLWSLAWAAQSLC